jgi:hypothetical protein
MLTYADLYCCINVCERQTPGSSLPPAVSSARNSAVAKPVERERGYQRIRHALTHALTENAMRADAVVCVRN